MKQADSEAGARKSLPSWVRRFGSATAATAFLLLAPAGAKADFVEVFHLSGNLNTILAPLGDGALVPFSGTIKLDIDDDLVHDTVESLSISAGGRTFNLSSSVTLAMSAIGVIAASNASHDTLSLMFSTPYADTWKDFENGDISFGYAVFNGAGSLLGAQGAITRFSGPPLIDPVTVPPDPPPTMAVPEPSTWTMILVGLAAFGLAAKGRRALAILGGRA